MVTPELLSAFPILKPLSKPVLQKLAGESSLRKFARRAVVMKSGEFEGHVCFLFEGRLQGVDFTIDGREVGLYFVEPGDFCGELGLFDGGATSEYIIALTAAVAVFIPAPELRTVMLRTPHVINVVSVKLAAKIRQLTYQRSLLGLPNIGQRVCCQLWMLIKNGREAEAAKATKAIIGIPPTQMEIAIMLNVSRETVTRVFQSLQNQQIVRRDGSTRLEVKDLPALRRLANGEETL